MHEIKCLILLFGFSFVNFEHQRRSLNVFETPYLRGFVVFENFPVLNISTSAQLTFAMPADFTPPDSPQLESSISYFPYFDSSYLAVAASLNGGNALATFVETLTAWMKELGMFYYTIVPDVFTPLIFSHLNVVY